MSRVSRREFLQTGAAAGASLTILPRGLSAASPNAKLRTAHVGVGGMGRADLGSISSHPGVEVVALCDVDTNNLASAGQAFPKARTFADYRQMFDRLADGIDAVIVSTPDHTHAPASLRALLAGKHVYCQKPLTHEVHEARTLRDVAEKRQLVTQMGVQVHASYPYRHATHLIQAGTIGKVREVHAWSNKNWGFDGPAPAGGGSEPPATLAWDLWLGTAPVRPYHAGLYHPGNWRKIVDFGTGTLGDMGVHIFDTPYRALKLTAPNWVKTTCRPPTGFGHPEKNVVEYEFPGTEHTTDTLRWVWYDGAFAPPKDRALPLPEGLALPDQGALFLGEKGVCLLPHVGDPQLYPKADFEGYKPPELPPLDHYHQFVDACLGKTTTSAHFGYGGALTEALLLGVIANRFPDTKLEWNAAGLKVTNVAEANALVRRVPREGFGVEGL